MGNTLLEYSTELVAMGVGRGIAIGMSLGCLFAILISISISFIYEKVKQWRNKNGDM